MYLLYAGEGAHPGVIDMFGAAVGILEIRAALLAAHGFAAMALAFFNFEDLPKEMNDLRLEYFQVMGKYSYIDAGTHLNMMLHFFLCDASFIQVYVF